MFDKFQDHTEVDHPKENNGVRKELINVIIMYSSLLVSAGIYVIGDRFPQDFTDLTSGIAFANFGISTYRYIRLYHPFETAFLDGDDN